jgi:hypothetical protein
MTDWKVGVNVADPVGDGRDDGRDHDVGPHLDRQRGPEHRSRVAARQVVGEQRQGDGEQTGADQRHDLRGEQPAEDGVAEDRDHGTRSRLSAYMNR